MIPRRLSLVETARLFIPRQRLQLAINRVPHRRREETTVAVLEFPQAIQIPVLAFPGHENFHKRLQDLQGDNGPVKFSGVEFFTVFAHLRPLPAAPGRFPSPAFEAPQAPASGPCLRV